MSNAQRDVIQGTGPNASVLLDLLGRADQSARPVVFAAAQRLGLGQRLQILVDFEPTSLMKAVAFQLRDSISWSATQHGPQWEIAVQPRAEAEAHDVVDLLTWDHFRLDRQFADVLLAANQNDMDEAEHIFKDYWIGLRRHVHLENNILGPALGGDAEHGPLSHMLGEHESIVEQARILEDAFNERDYGLLAPICAVLSGSLAKHENREENTLFPIWQTACNADRGRSREFLLRAKALLAGAEDREICALFP